LRDRHLADAGRSRSRPTLNGVKRIVHISDLHLGRNRETDDSAARLAGELIGSNVDCVVVTGNLTHNGRRDEWTLFQDLFARLIRQQRLVAVPGERDRLGDDLGWAIMPGPRVQTASRAGLHVVRVNSTAGRSGGRAALDDADLKAIDVALDAAPLDSVSVVALHHDLVRLPARHGFGRLTSWVDYSMAPVLGRGAELLKRVEGRCDLVLHGRRSDPRGTSVAGGARPLSMFNAGSSTELGHAYVFSHDRAGGLRSGAMWLDVRGLRQLGGTATPSPEPIASLMVA
jgi:Icc protein